MPIKILRKKYLLVQEVRDKDKYLYFSWHLLLREVYKFCFAVFISYPHLFLFNSITIESKNYFKSYFKTFGL